MSGKEDRIRARAYELWEREGRAHGNHESHWQEATRQVEAELAGEAVAPRKASGSKARKTGKPPSAGAAASPSDTGSDAANPARRSRIAKTKTKIAGPA